MKQFIQFIKNKLIILFILLLIPNTAFCKVNDRVTLSKCIDGDTARFILNNEEIKVRFLGINSPEIEKPGVKGQAYGEEASNYTCKKLKNAKIIELEYDDASSKLDKYNRVLAYIIVDGKLLEESIVKNGYANVKYMTKKYKYYDTLKDAEDYAINNKKGMYSLKKEVTKEEDYFEEIKKYVFKNAKKLFSQILKEIFN
ncbi:MAG: thermonuclease family protein [Bacilli bacterium]|nr:thermonuclease family protein [Bacilli bacterium]